MYGQEELEIQDLRQERDQLNRTITELERDYQSAASERDQLRDEVARLKCDLEDMHSEREALKHALNTTEEQVLRLKARLPEANPDEGVAQLAHDLTSENARLEVIAQLVLQIRHEGNRFGEPLWLMPLLDMIEAAIEAPDCDYAPHVPVTVGGDLYMMRPVPTAHETWCSFLGVPPTTPLSLRRLGFTRELIIPPGGCITPRQGMIVDVAR